MKVKVIGTALIVTTVVTAVAAEKAKKYAPQALVVCNDKGEPVYKMAGKANEPFLGKYGTAFNGVDSEGCLTATFVIPDQPDADTKKTYVTDNFGLSLAALDAYESTIVAQIEAAVGTIETAVANMIVE